MKNYTDITVLLDRSGSMRACAEATETGFADFIKEHKTVASTRITLIQFDDKNDQQVVYQNVPVNNADKLKLTPRGNTPLLDAVCKAIDNTGERLSEMNEKDRPKRVLMVIITDGQENASKIHKTADVRDRINRQQDKYAWEFIYIGANQDTWTLSQDWGLKWGNTISWTPDKAHTHGVWASATANTISYANATGLKQYNENQRSISANKVDRSFEPNNTGSTHNHTITTDKK